MEGLKIIRKKKGLTQESVATYLGIATNTYSQYESGKRQPNIEILKKLSRYYNISIDSLVSGKVDLNSSHNSIAKKLSSLDQEKLTKITGYIDTISDDKSSHLKPVRVLGEVAAGYPILAITDDENVVYTDKNADFALKVRGDSMEPKIHDGDIILIREQATLNTGEIGIVQIHYDAEHSEVTCKKVYVHPTHLELISLNKKYDPIILEPDQYMSYSILGKVIPA